MQELVDLSIKLHVIFIYAMIFLGLINLIFIFSSKNFIKFTKRIRFVSPQYYMMLAAIFFTGIIVLGITRFEFSLSIVLMLIAWLAIFILSIKSYKIYKKTHPKDEYSTSAYRNFSIKKYALDICLLLGVTLYSLYW